ncbi:uncharacterized protein isoform X2 [Macaca fascicularis]|uniref:uncharacterized protein isoform X2 n=1 Tax=Macaca fascicularis TaxID=9541 RepID=UPI0032B04BC3
MASQIRRHLNPLERWGFSMFPRLVSNSWAQAICPSCLPKCSSKKGVCHHAQPEQLLFLRCWPSDPKSPAVLSADCDCMCQDWLQRCKYIGRCLLKIGQRTLRDVSWLFVLHIDVLQHLHECLNYVKFWTSMSFHYNSFLSSKKSSLIALSGFWRDNYNLFEGKNILSVLQYPETSVYTDQHQFEFLPDWCH